MYNDDDFNYNHGIALAATRNYKAAEEALLLIHNERYKSEYVYISWLARCYVMNGNPRSAWELYLKMNSSNESFNLLQVLPSLFLYPLPHPHPSPLPQPRCCRALSRCPSPHSLPHPHPSPLPQPRCRRALSLCPSPHSLPHPHPSPLTHHATQVL